MKAKLLETLSETRVREAELEAHSVDGPADPDGRWGAKDHLAHLAWWRENNSARTIDSIRSGAEPPARVVDDTVQNAEIYEATKNLSVADVKQSTERSWEALENAVAACTEEDLLKELPSTRGFGVWELVPAHAGHVGVHLMSWLLDHRNVKAAKAAAMWAHRVETEATSDPIKRADADYNLACFYARTGQPDEALPLLRRSFDANRELLEWAHKDTDLDTLRDMSEFKELLAT